MTDTISRRFDLIAFDWDGTLYDSTAIIVRCIQAAVVAVGGSRPSDRDAAWVIGLGLAEALARVAPDVPRERYQELGARYRHHDGAAGVVRWGEASRVDLPRRPEGPAHRAAGARPGGRPRSAAGHVSAVAEATGP